MVFWMELVPSLGRELVECCLAEDVREEVVVEVRMMEGGGGLGDPGGESSDSLASI